MLLAGGVTYVLLRPPSATTGATASAPTPVLLPPPAQKHPEKQLTVAASVPIPAIAGEIPVGSTPGYVAIAPNGTFAYVANRAAGVVTVVDTAIDKVVATIPLPDGPPQYLAFSPDGSRLYVSVFHDPDRSINEVAVLDTRTNTVLTTIKVGTRPYALAVRAGRVGDLRPEPRLGHGLGDRDQGRTRWSPTSGSSRTRTGSTSPRTAPGPTRRTTTRTWSA